MADTTNSDSGAHTASEVATSDENVEVIKSQFSKSCTENLEVDIDDIKTNRHIEGTNIEVVNGSGADLGILEQADTTSVENLSIVTVVEKELEPSSEIIQNSKIALALFSQQNQDSITRRVSEITAIGTLLCSFKTKTIPETSDTRSFLFVSNSF